MSENESEKIITMTRKTKVTLGMKGGSRCFEDIVTDLFKIQNITVSFYVVDIKNVFHLYESIAMHPCTFTFTSYYINTKLRR